MQRECSPLERGRPALRSSAFALLGTAAWMQLALSA